MFDKKLNEHDYQLLEFELIRSYKVCMERKKVYLQSKQIWDTIAILVLSSAYDK